MASSSKRKGSIKTVEWWKHLRDMKRVQEKIVREDGKAQVEEQTNETLLWFNQPDPWDALDTEIEERMREIGFDPDNRKDLETCLLNWQDEWNEWVAGRDGKNAPELPETPEKPVARFTSQQIREWLEGWFLSDGEGNPAGSLSLTQILALLDCDQDGIEAYFNR